MGRILLLHPDKGFEELIKGVLSDLHQVEVLKDLPSAPQLAEAGQMFGLVLCSIDVPNEAIAAFDAVSTLWPRAILVPVSASVAQIAGFAEKWNADPRRKEKCGTMGAVWLPQRCTAGQILGLLREREEVDAGPAHSSPALAPLSSGSIIDGYRLVSLIGQGGFGTLWLAVSETTGKRVAIKVIEGAEPLVQELAALRKYVHVAHRSEHLLSPEHINSTGARLWIVNPLADSITGADAPEAYKPLSLANRLDAKGHLPEPEALSICQALVRGLSTLHDAGLLHGDVSPNNILRVRGVWVLADPGLVRFVGQHGICRDRRYYPQAASVRPSDDLYAVGLTLWDMVSGIWGMVSGKETMRLDAQMLRFLSKKNVPVLKIISRSVTENLNARYMNAEDMLLDIESLIPAPGLEATSPYQLYNELHTLRTGLAEGSSS